MRMDDLGKRGFLEFRFGAQNRTKSGQNSPENVRLLHLHCANVVRVVQ